MRVVVAVIDKDGGRSPGRRGALMGFEGVPDCVEPYLGGVRREPVPLIVLKLPNEFQRRESGSRGLLGSVNYRVVGGVSAALFSASAAACDRVAAFVG